MQITPKARLISLIVAIVFMAGALIGSGAYLIINHINSSATTETDYIMTTNLFNTDGTINPTAANTLLEAVGYYDYEATTTGYKAHQIRSRTDSTGTDVASNPDATIIFPMGYYVSDDGSIDTSKPLYWQATYLYNNYLTIWMVKGYTNSDWNSSSVTVSYSTYANSTIQNYLDNTLWDDLTQSSSELRSVFALPSTAGYQNSGNESLAYNNSDTSYYSETRYTSKFDNLASSVRSGSYLWLPSFGEVANNTSSSYTNSTTSYTGQWGLNSADRAFNATNYDGSGSGSYCWLRSGTTGGTISAMRVYSLGSAGSYLVYNSYGVRPAAHLDLDAIAEAAKPSYTIAVHSNNTTYGTVNTSGGTYKQGTQIELEATTNSGCEFVGWDINGDGVVDSTANPYTYTVMGDATITAIFRQLISVIIRTNNTEYGQIFVNGSLITSTTVIQDANTQINNIMALPTANSAFLYWYDESNGNIYYDNPLNYIITQNTTITAYFGSGLVDGVAVSVESILGDTAAIGEARITGYANIDGVDYVHFSAVAYTGYRFVGWRIDGEILAGYTESADIPYSTVENKQVFAVFEPINSSNINNGTDNGYSNDFV